jgi:hypothetical protein
VVLASLSNARTYASRDRDTAALIAAPYTADDGEDGCGGGDECAGRRGTGRGDCVDAAELIFAYGGDY